MAKECSGKSFYWGNCSILASSSCLTSSCRRTWRILKKYTWCSSTVRVTSRSWSKAASLSRWFTFRPSCGIYSMLLSTSRIAKSFIGILSLLIFCWTRTARSRYATLGWPGRLTVLVTWRRPFSMRLMTSLPPLRRKYPWSLMSSKFLNSRKVWAQPTCRGSNLRTCQTTRSWHRSLLKQRIKEKT